MLKSEVMQEIKTLYARNVEIFYKSGDGTLKSHVSGTLASDYLIEHHPLCYKEDQKYKCWQGLGIQTLKQNLEKRCLKLADNEVVNTDYIISYKILDEIKLTVAITLINDISTKKRFLLPTDIIYTPKSWRFNINSVIDKSCDVGFEEIEFNYNDYLHLQQSK